MNLEIENYEWEEIHKILGKINNRIEAFRGMYRRKPKFIIISEKLEYILRNQMELMCQNEMIILNDEELSKESTCSVLEQVQIEGTRSVKRQKEYYNLDMIISIGFSCFSSPSLSNLEFEIR